MSLDWKRRGAWQVRSRWIGVLILVALFVFLVSRFLPELHEQERGYVEGATDAFAGTVLDKGRRPRTSTRDWGLVDFFPHVALEDGRRVVLEVGVAEADIPAVGAPIAVRCLRAAPARCRMDTRAGTFINVLGFGAIVLIWLSGMGLMALRILRAPRRAPAAARP